MRSAAVLLFSPVTAAFYAVFLKLMIKQQNSSIPHGCWNWIHQLPAAVVVAVSVYRRHVVDLAAVIAVVFAVAALGSFVMEELVCHAWTSSVASNINRMWMISGIMGNTPMSDYGSNACVAANWRRLSRRERTVDMNTVPVPCSFLFCNAVARCRHPAMEKQEH